MLEEDVLSQSLFEEDPEPHEDPGGSSLETESVFYLILIVHLLCGVIRVIEEVLEAYDMIEVCQFFFSTILGNTLYLGCIIYCIF